MDLTGRTVVVTGGASGIGKAMAERFAMEAAQGVVVADIDGAGAEAAAERVPGAAIGVACDVTDEAALNELIDRAESEFGQIDIFCANAGIGAGAGLDASDEVWRQVMEVNAMSHVYAARRLVPGWLERGEGYFVSTASAAGLLSQIGDVTYTVSKHAAVAFAEWLALTYGDRGVGVTCVCPQAVDTPMLDLGGALVEAGAAATLASGALLPAAQVAAAALDGVREGRFLVLPHAEVAEYWRRKAADPERWLAGMRRLQAKSIAEGGA